ncbi:hypothetical protein ACXYMO_01145 [Arenibacterium sp. CAU 1754]
MSSVRRLFTDHGAPAPIILWNPDTRMDGNSLLNQFSRLCDQISDSAGCIQSERLSMRTFGTMADWLMRLKPEGAPSLYRYVHFGSGIATVFGRDMTGACSNDFGGHTSAFFATVYQAAARRQQRVMTVHQTPHQIFVSSWRRLIMPVVDASGAHDGFLVFKIPENELRSGLEIVPAPILIADADMIVRYANKGAREAFDGGAYGPWNRSLFDYAALDLEPDDSPTDILRRGIVHTCITRYVHHQQIGRYQAKISAMMHHGTAFYVILLQTRLQ